MTAFGRCASILVLMTGVLAGTQGAAHADAAGALFVHHTWMQPGSTGDTASSTGFGAEFGIAELRKPFLLTLGGFYTLGQREEGKRMRDVYDVRLGFGFKPPVKQRAVIPFAAVGLDLLYIATRMPDRTTHAGATVGFDARGGLFGFVGERWLYQVSISYTGAIAPGTGDGLDGVALHIGIGKIILD